MAKRLIKVAKELNVGTASIVDFLVHNGFSIENKPTSQVSDEMIEELTKEFQGSKDIKEQADHLVIGVRPPAKKDPQENVILPPSPPPAPEVIPEPETETKSEPVVETPIEKPIVEPPIEPPAQKEEKTKVGLTIKGKIDLDELNKPKKKKEPVV